MPAHEALDRDGVVAGARQVPSPNADDRPDGVAPELVVIHGISLPPGRYGGDSIERLFTNTLDRAADPSFDTIAALRVSAHFLIRRDGELLQFVPCSRRAWHAGVSSWRGREGCNAFSIGIELEGTDTDPYDARQYARLASLLRATVASYPIASILGHEHIAPGRKTDPGPSFDWNRLEHDTALAPSLFADRRTLAAPAPNA